jgi:hypothetical protein
MLASISDLHPVTLASLSLFAAFLLYSLLPSSSSSSKHGKSNPDDTAVQARDVPRVTGGWPVLGHAIEYGTDPCAFIERCRKIYGGAFIVSALFLVSPLLVTWR